MAARDLGTLSNISPKGLIMASALVRDGVPKPCGGGVQMDTFSPSPRMPPRRPCLTIWSVFNKQHKSRPHSFCLYLPSVEDLAFLVQSHSMLPPTLSLSDVHLSHLNNPFLRELDMS